MVSSPRKVLVEKSGVKLNVYFSGVAVAGSRWATLEETRVRTQANHRQVSFILFSPQDRKPG
jgi:hypothetical protein